MSSAEDKTSSTVLPPQASSNSAPEEFPVDAKQGNAPVHTNEHSPSALASEPAPVELKVDASPEHSPEDPGDDAGTPLKTKPLPKVNAAAREIRVKVTGTRVGSAFIERELFTESTTTVLVFEKGGVIRLTAAVAPGQLIFLTNEESQREVVALVLRKRDYRPMECYVEFEFTEPTSGFWGMEFSAATALLPPDKNVAAAAEMISSAETTEDEMEQPARPDSSDVEALKREVAALRSQLGQLQTPEPVQVEPAGTPQKPAAPIPPAPSISPLDALPVPAQPAAPSYQTEKAPWTELSADVAPMAGEPKPPRVYSPDQDLQAKLDVLLKPDSQPKPALVFRQSMLQPKRSFRARGEFTPGFRAGMLRLAVLSLTLAALIGFVWYKRWFPWMHQPTKFAVSSFAGGVTTKVAPETSTGGPAPLATQPSKSGTGATDPLSAKGASSVRGSSGAPSMTTAMAKENEMAPYEVVPKPAEREKSRPAAASIANANPSQVQPLPAKMAVPVSAGNPNIVPPKLMKSERAVATLEDLRDFETGNVVIDAIVDTDGNVTSPTVLSGPPSLRRPALEALKYYRYKPATQNGRPVAAHVTVTMQFHFE